MNPQRSLRKALGITLLILVVVASAGAVLTHGASASGMRVLSSKSFVGTDGHLYTRADLSIDGRTVRGVVAPGGRLGDRWESVESFVAEGGSNRALSTVEQFRLQAGQAAGSTVVSNSSTSGSSLGPSTYATLYGYGYCSRSLDVPYRVNTAHAPYGAVTAIRAGFNVWTHDPSSWMSFVYKGATSEASAVRSGTNTVWFGSNSDAFLGRTWTYGDGAHLTGFDMQLNTKYPLTIGGSGYDLQSVVAHEAGHAAGFNHTSSVNNLMYGGGQPARALYHSLGAQDRAGLAYLYPYNDLRAVLTSVKGPGVLHAGQVGTVTATFQNKGRTPWGGGLFKGLRIRTTNNASSPFKDATWPAASLAAINGSAICQGEQVTVTWKMHAPSTAKTYSVSFTPVAGDPVHTKWLVGAVVNFSVVVSGSSSTGTGTGSSGSGTTGSGTTGSGSSCWFFCW